MDDKPEFVPLWLRCEPCGHVWNEWQPSRVRIKVWTTYVRLIHCPECGFGLRGLKILAKPPDGFVD